MPRGSTYTPEVYRANTVDRTAKINTENTYAILNRLQGEVDYLKRISSLALLIDGSNQMLANLHLNGFNLDLDVDRDTYLGTDGDDHVELVMNGPSGQFDITINGADDFTFTANSFNVLAGSSINVAPAAFITFGDGDSYIYEPADDNIEIVLAGAGGEFSININGAEDFNFTANSLHVLSGSHIQMADDTWIGLGAELDPGIGKLYFDSSPATHEMRLVLMNLDLNNNDVVFDTDGDTYIHATADDVVTLVLATAAGGFKININGAEDFNFTANTLNVLVGSHVEMGDDTWIGFTAGGQLVWDSTPADNEIRVVGASLDMNGNTIIFDGDGDTFVEVIGDDDIAFTFPLDGIMEIAFDDVDFTFTTNSFNVLAGSHQEMADDTWIGATGGAQIEFDYTPAVDEINFLNCYSGWGTQAPVTVIHIYRNDALTTPQFLIEQDDTGDASLEFLLTGGQSYTAGIDNSTTGDLFLIEPAAALASGYKFAMNSTGDIGMGVVPVTTAQLNLQRVQTGVTVNQTCFNTELDLTFANALTSMENMFLTVRYRGTQNITGDATKGLGAACFNVFNYATAGTVDRAYGLRTDLRNLSTGTITALYGLWGGYAVNSGGGTVSYYYGTKIENYPVGTTWNAAFQSEFNIDGVKNWAFYGNGTAPIRTNGRIDIDSDSYGLQIGEGQDGYVIHDGSHFYIRNLVANANTEFIFDNFTTQDMDCIVNIKAGESKDAILRLTADEADDNADNARIVHYAATNAVSWEDYSSGAWVAYLTKKSGGIINMSNVPVYANNAAAAAGGLVAGDLYRTNGDPDPVCIVH